MDNDVERTDGTRADEKWGAAINPGFQILPDALVRGQHLLKLSPTDLNVILNLNQAWWYSDRLPFIRPHTIAKRMNVSERTVQRSLSRMRQRGLLSLVRDTRPDGSVLYKHDLSGLQNKVEQLARRDMAYKDQELGVQRSQYASVDSDQI